MHLVAGQKYTVGMVGTGALSDGVKDTFVRLRDSNGSLLAYDDDDGPGLFSNVTYKASTTGTYYIEAHSYGYKPSDTGAYGVSVVKGSLASYDVAMGAGVLMRPDVSWSSEAGAAADITWGLRSSSSTAKDAQGNAVAFAQLTDAQTAAVNDVVGLFDGVSGLNLNQVNPGGTTNSATVLFGAYSSTSDGSGAYAYDPGTAENSGDVWLNNTHVNESSLPLGSYSRFVLLHELGHAVGLSHPGDYNASPGVSINYETHAQFQEDSRQFSVMSYFDESNITENLGGYPDTLLLYDLYALHQLYGAERTFHSGNSVYGFNSNLSDAYDFNINSDPFICIWDGNGYDTLDLSGYSQSQRIFLSAGKLSDVGGYEGNVSIATGAVIERAIGGGGNDTIEGNDYANRIYGNDGNDVLKGGHGKDTLGGGDGRDYLSGGTGADSLIGQTGNDKLLGGASTDILRGDEGNDTLSGGTGNDTLYGGDGHDTMYGNTSLDRLFGGDGDDYISSGDGVDYVNGEAGNDTIFGRSGWDELFGGAGDDVIFGSEGKDMLDGGIGNDKLSGGSGWDVLHGKRGDDLLYGNFGSDALVGGRGKDSLFGGTGDDTLRGGEDADVLFGNQGVDYLDGGPGDDLLRGGTQRDTFVLKRVMAVT